MPESIKQQYNDNIRWIKEAGKHNMVVGSQARILYSDQKGRIAIAQAFNKAVGEGKLKVGGSKPDISATCKVKNLHLQYTCTFQ